MLKETLSSLNTASGHGLLKGPWSHREASVTSHVAVCTGRFSLSPSGCAEHQNKVCLPQKGHQGESWRTCAELTFHFSPSTFLGQLDMHRLNSTSVGFSFKSKIFLAKVLERNYDRSSWEIAGSPWRDSYDMDRKWPGVSPGKEKTDIAPASEIY